MKKQDILLMFAILVVLLFSCNNTEEAGTKQIVISNISISSETTDKVEAVSNEHTSSSGIEVTDGNEMGGSLQYECLKHEYFYHGFPTGALTEKQLKIFEEYMSPENIIGKNACEIFNINSIRKALKLTREEFEKIMDENFSLKVSQMLGYDEKIFSKERIDAIYSDNQMEIDQLFLNDVVSFYHEGKIYDPFWFANNLEADYEKLDFPLEDVKKVQKFLDVMDFIPEQKRKTVDQNIEKYEAYIEEKAELAKQNELRLEK